MPQGVATGQIGAAVTVKSVCALDKLAPASKQRDGKLSAGGRSSRSTTAAVAAENAAAESRSQLGLCELNGIGYSVAKAPPMDPGSVSTVAVPECHLLSYQRSPWSVHNINHLDGSVLGHISGITSSSVHVGMCFASFCWRNADHHSYSLHYNHWGAAQSWYCVPASDRAKFEDAMK
jgi:hypothetical protein